jgi:hypothetical protein
MDIIGYQNFSHPASSACRSAIGRVIAGELRKSTKQRALRATARGASTAENLLEEERQLIRIDHDYDDIPGTYVFDAERSRRGYGINMFCIAVEEGEPRRIQSRRSEVSGPIQADVCATGSDPQAAVESDAGARRQHLFYRQTWRDRRPIVLTSRGHHDRQDAAGGEISCVVGNRTGDGRIARVRTRSCPPLSSRRRSPFHRAMPAPHEPGDPPMERLWPHPHARPTDAENKRRCVPRSQDTRIVVQYRPFLLLRRQDARRGLCYTGQGKLAA